MLVSAFNQFVLTVLHCVNHCYLHTQAAHWSCNWSSCLLQPCEPNALSPFALYTQIEFLSQPPLNLQSTLNCVPLCFLSKQTVLVNKQIKIAACSSLPLSYHPFWLPRCIEHSSISKTGHRFGCCEGSVHNWYMNRHTFIITRVMRFPFSGKEEEKCTIEIREAVESREGYSFVAAGTLCVYQEMLSAQHSFSAVHQCAFPCSSSCQCQVWSPQISGVLS